MVKSHFKANKRDQVLWAIEQALSQVVMEFEIESHVFQTWRDENDEQQLDIFLGLFDESELYLECRISNNAPEEIKRVAQEIRSHNDSEFNL